MINTAWWFCGALLCAELSLVGWDGASQEDWILSLELYLLDLKIWTQIRKGKENKKQDKLPTKAWDLEQIKTGSCQPRWTCYFTYLHQVPPGVPVRGGSAPEQAFLYSTAVYWRPTMCQALFQVFEYSDEQKSQRSLCKWLSGTLSKGFSITWTQGLNSGSATW